MRRVASALAAASVLAAVTGTVTASPVQADSTQSKVVSANPANSTPNALDGTVYAFAVVGSKIVVGGSFTQIRNAGSKTVVKQKYLFAYDAKTGKIDTGFKPALNGTVYALATGPSGTVFAGGSFTTVNGAANRGLVRLTPTGKRTGKFALGNGNVRDLISRGSQLYVGGAFTKINGASRSLLARLNTSTGAVDSKINFSFSDPINGGALKIYDMALTPGGSRLVTTGSFMKVSGKSRPQVAMFDTSGSLTTWATSRYGPVCNNAAFDSYIRDVDFSPDGKYFVIVTTGGPFGNTTLCDSAARWETAKTGAGQQPTWVNWTGGDSLYAVSVTGAAVYVGGHQRWLNNPYGHDSAGPGAVSRPGIGALSAGTGKALSWNPTRTRGHGVEVLDAYASGLLVGSDTEELGHEYHARLGMFPLS
ncbi:MAG TPA: hypothetical protein VH912_26085 [Streptosporangiaceae bacterium]|jgi:hypothetical protein